MNIGELSQSFDHFAVGDYVTFERSFSQGDFAKFADLSGDRNPLHHDRDYSERSATGQPIVPLHMTLAPISMIAGMVLPGEPSRYLGHEARALRPIHYDEIVSYSARIEAINASHQVLTLRVLAFRGIEVLIDAKVHVQARERKWSSPPSIRINKATEPAVALITGAAGEIGGAIADVLARKGWKLLLHCRQTDDRTTRLADRLLRLGVTPEFVTGDLEQGPGQHDLANAVRACRNLALVVHAASPAVTASVDSLVAVNFSALKCIADAALPGMLARQGGNVVLIGSTATEHTPSGWASYAGAKSMAANLVTGIEREYSGYGVRGITVMAGMVETRFSESVRERVPMLLPYEVADAVVEAIADERAAGNAVIVESGGTRRGRLGFYSQSTATDAGNPPALPRDDERLPAQRLPSAGPSSSVVGAIARRLFGLASADELADAGLGVTPGWDSLRHIELLLEIERSTGIQFSSAEMEVTHRFVDLDVLCRKKLSERAAGSGSN